MNVDDIFEATSCTAEDVETGYQPEQKRPGDCRHVWYWVGAERRCRGCVPEPPASPPNQHIREGDQYAYDIVTGDPYIDKAIARHRGSIPRPWWWRLRRWWRS